jgi:two-component system LytT family sensor kinase
MFSGGQLKMVLSAVLIIWVLLAGIFIMLSTKSVMNPLLIIIDTGVHTLLITFSILVAQTLYRSIHFKKKWVGYLSLITLVYLGVIIGELVSQYFAQKVLYRGAIPEEMFVKSLIFSLFVSTIFCAVFSAYEMLRLKLEKAMLVIKQKEVNEHLLKSLKSQAELQALQAKINPHFLFNTLNSIAALITIDPEKAEVAVEKLSKIFRFTLKNSTTSKVLVSESLDFVKSYLELEKLRLGERLKFDVELIGPAEDVYVFDLLIQPLVENSIKHGIGPKVGGGKIDVRVEVKSDYLEIYVNDNGQGLIDKETDSGHGLVNIKQRLELAYQNNYEMIVEDDQGVKVFLKIPKESNV